MSKNTVNIFGIVVLAGAVLLLGFMLFAPLDSTEDGANQTSKVALDAGRSRNN